MKINLTKKQYEALLKLCYIGNWMVNAQRDGSKDDPMIEKYEQIYEYIQSFAPDSGLDDFVQFDKEMNRYFATRKFEEADDTHGLIDEYDENSFWDDLIDRLTSRDMSRIFSPKELTKISFEKFAEKRLPIMKKWEKEINNNGLDRLEINAK